MLTPSLNEFMKDIERGRYRLLRRRIPADLETPVSVFLKLKPEGATFLLESVERGIQMGRYSFIGLSPFATIRLQNDTVEIQKDGKRLSLPLTGRDPLCFLRDELKRFSSGPMEEFPAPMGGAVGYLSYDFARYFERLPAPARNELELPDYCFLFPSALVVFDHVKSEIEIVSILRDAGDPELAYGAAHTRIDALFSALSLPLAGGEISAGTASTVTETANMTADRFETLVRRAKDHIIAGDALQIVLSQRIQGRTRTSPFQTYRALRILNPSPYMFFIDFGDFQLIGSSPEVLVKLEHGRAMLNPIAGTRPRGADAAEDGALETELRTNEKERAEHVMLVDLGRNDLGRVCELGTIKTESLMQVEKYSHVMHLVSRITGTLRKDLDMFDLLRAAFPAGTLTGAPKVRAMEIIADLEGERRGPYGGAVGYFGSQGDMDMCITIRTIVMKDDRYYIQGGAGIVADSDPRAEYEETLHKIEALRTAVRIAERGL